MHNLKEKRYDALVIGAGPAGATAGLMLARAGWSVAIIERAPFPRRKVCGEFMSATNLGLLRQFGVADDFLAQAGPPVRKVGLYAGETVLTAEMPRPRDGIEPFGRALGREHLDTLMLDAAREAGAEVWQPWSVKQLDRVADGGYEATATSSDKQIAATLRTRIVIAAHGSWEHGLLPTHVRAAPPRHSDLFAFKAHFVRSGLPAEFMPLLLFQGGYGGMVHTDGRRVTLSCCIRRDVLALCRRQRPQQKAADAVIAHIRETCGGVDRALAPAMRDGSWLSAGPIRPGIRVSRDDEIFVVGNAAGEAHPIVAEGISMAIQSSSLLCSQLMASRPQALTQHFLSSVAESYADSWRKNFSRRVYAAAVFANLATRPLAAKLSIALLERAPLILTWGAYLAGKSQLPAFTRSDIA